MYGRETVAADEVLRGEVGAEGPEWARGLLHTLLAAEGTLSSHVSTHH